jgi:hypothetical protein
MAKDTLEGLCSDACGDRGRKDTSLSPPAATFFQFDKYQYTGTLSESGDQMDLTLVVSIYNDHGQQTGKQDEIKFKAARVPLEILPNTAITLPVPEPPQ